MKAHPHFANVLNIETLAPMFVLAQFAPIPVGVFDAVEAVAPLEAGKPWLFANPYPSKEGRERFVKTAKHMLNAGRVQLAECIRAIVAQITEVRPLRTVIDPLARFLIGCNPLFKGGIVDQPGLPKQKIQFCNLLSIWAKEVFVSVQHKLTSFLHLDITPYSFFGDVADCANVVTSTPQTRKPGTEFWELLAKQPRCVSFELIGKPLGCFGWIALDKQVNVVGHDFQCLNRYIQLLRLLIQQGTQFTCNLTHQHLAPKLRTPDEVIFQRENTSCIASIPRVAHKTSVLQH